MNSSIKTPARAARQAILRGNSADGASLARLDTDLRDNPYALAHQAGARLVDPRVAEAFEAAAAAAREEGRREGLAQGYAEGIELARAQAQAARDDEHAQWLAAEQARQDSLETTLALLRAAASEYATRQAAALDSVEDLLLDAAYDLATMLLGRELASATDPVRDAVRRALSVLPDESAVTIFVHPVDAERLADIAELAPGCTLRVVADHNVKPGSCLANAGATHVNASLDAALQRVQGVLSA